MSEIMDNYLSKVSENEKDLINQSIIIGGGHTKSNATEKMENMSADTGRSVDD